MSPSSSNNVISLAHHDSPACETAMRPVNGLMSTDFTLFQSAIGSNGPNSSVSEVKT